MANDTFTRIGSRFPGAKKQQFGGDAYDWIGGFSLSALESIPELVGIKPSGATEQWRMENPAASFLSQVGGMSVPYAGWFAATKKIKAIDKALEGIGDMSRAPFLTGAAREAARFAPFEAGRVIASQFVGEEDLGTMAGEAALNLGIGAGLGGVVSSIASAGTRAFPLAKLAPGIDVAAPIQLQQRYLQELLNKGGLPEEALGQIRYKLGEMRTYARAEQLPQGTRYINSLEGATPAASDQINRLFRTDNPKSGFVRKRFVQGGGNFVRQDDWRKAATEAGLPANFEDLGQYFRQVSFRGSKAPTVSGAWDRTISKNLESQGNGWFMRREADDGLFVMARKVKGEVGKPDQGDQWLVFKTDQPGSFLPERQRWANTMVSKTAWSPQANIAKDGGQIYNTLTSFMEKFPFTNYRVLVEDPQGIGAAIDKLMPKKLRGKQSELVERFRDGVKEYLAPARFQFTKSPRANWIHAAARAVYDAAETEGQRLLYGELRLDPKKNVFQSALRGQQQEGPSTQVAVKTLLDSLEDKQVEELWKVWRNQATGDDLQGMVNAGEISPRVRDVALSLEKLDSDLWANLNKVQNATGNVLTKKRGGHYGLSHQWEGDTRIALRGEDERVVAVASGFNRRGAQARAKELQEILGREGIQTRVAEEFQLSQMDRIPQDIRPVLKSPGFTLEQQGIRGFRWDDKPFTREELLEGLQNGVRGRLRYQANLSTQDLFQSQMTKLAFEDPVAYRLLTARLNDLAGVQGNLGVIQNQVVDQIMGPMLGSNSASKIAQVANTVLWHLQLGAGKLSYPIVNALTFLQTVVPEVAYVTSAAPERLAGKYTYFATGGTRGPVGSVGVLNPLTLMRDSLREMRTPGKGLMEALERATNERVIDPRLVEEYIGESATKLSDLRSAISSPGNFAGWLKAVSEFLPAQSERLSRAHAFTVGHLLARDYLQLTGEASYRFARQFTENSMFLYTTADRPRIFTTPAGSMFGLFKNWMANYTGSMLEYMGEGVMHNNWSPLLWQTSGTFMVGGLAATPMAMVADGFSKAFTGNSLLENTYEAFGGNNQVFGDGLMYGLPAVISDGHISLYSQSSSPMSNPVRDADMLFSTAHLDRLQYFMKSMSDGWDHWQATGEHPGGNKQFLQSLARAVAPTTIYRIIGAAEEGMINSLSTGYPIMKDVGLMDRLFYMAGFNSLEMDKAYAISTELFADKEKHKAQVARLGQAYAEYQLAKDSNGMMYVLKQAYAAGIDPSSVLRSSQARVGKMTQPMLERNFKPEDLARFQRVLGGTE